MIIPCLLSTSGVAFIARCERQPISLSTECVYIDTAMFQYRKSLLSEYQTFRGKTTIHETHLGMKVGYISVC